MILRLTVVASLYARTLDAPRCSKTPGSRVRRNHDLSHVKGSSVGLGSRICRRDMGIHREWVQIKRREPGGAQANRRDKNKADKRWNKICALKRGIEISSCPWRWIGITCRWSWATESMAPYTYLVEKPSGTRQTLNDSPFNSGAVRRCTLRWPFWRELGSSGERLSKFNCKWCLRA